MTEPAALSEFETAPLAAAPPASGGFCRPEKAAPRAAGVKAVNLALQGGGAHGAFAWGVLDYLLEDGRLGIEAVSATSAGAMNAAVLATGLLRGGREGARRALHGFWQAVSEAGAVWNPVRPGWWNHVSGSYSLDHAPSYVFFDMLTRVLSPYEFNPFGIDPLRSILVHHADFEALRTDRTAVRLHLCATNVETGKARIFTNREISPEAVLASACLPFLFQAVEIGGEYFWDGGYIGNPAIFPLIYEGSSRDVVIVHINPIVRRGCPKRAAEILNRVNELSFNSSLLRELRAIAFVSRLIDTGKIKDGEMKRMFIHAIRADEFMAGLGVSSKLNSSWGFFMHLRDAGREAARMWLSGAYDRIGRDSTLDLHAEFL